MKTLVLILAVSLAACATPAEMAPSARPRAVVERMFEAFNRHDRAASEALYASDAIDLSPDYCTPRHGREAIGQMTQHLFDVLPDIHDDVDEIVAEREWVAVHFTTRAQAGALQVPVAGFFEVHDGQIVRAQTIYDARGRPCMP